MYRDPHLLLIQYKLLCDLSEKDHQPYSLADLWFQDDYLKFFDYLFELERQQFITVHQIAINKSVVEEIRSAQNELSREFDREVSVQSMGNGYEIMPARYYPLPDVFWESAETNLDKETVKEFQFWASKYSWKIEPLRLWNDFFVYISVTPEQKQRFESDFDNYLQDYQSDHIYQPGENLPSYNLQREKLLSYLAKESTKLQKKNGITVKPYSGLSPQDGRLWEVVISLAKEGIIRIVELFWRERNSYFVIDIQSPIYNAELVRSFFVQQKKELEQDLMQIQYSPQLKLTVDRLLHAKQAVDNFSHLITVVPDESTKKTFVVQHKNDVAYSQADHLYKLGIFGYADSMSFQSWQTEYVILNENGFKQYHTEISNLYGWLNTEYRKRVEPKPALTSYKDNQKISKLESRKFIDTWEELRLHFTNAHEVTAYKGQSKVCVLTYVDLGCRNKTKDAPDEKWKFLQQLALNKGQYDLSGLTKEDKWKYQQRKRGLSQALKKYFNLTTDPFFPYKEVDGYKTKFSITPETGLSPDQDASRIRDINVDPYGISEGYQDMTRGSR